MATNNPITRITLFGALEIAHGSAAPRRPPTQRVLALLGYLIAHHNVPQARDKLVDLLWPDLLPRQGRRMLSDTLWRARRLLSPSSQDDTPALLIAGDTVAFRPDASTWVDLIAFEQALHDPKTANEGADERLRAAVELYRGDFLEDCYDDWALFERERLREQYLSALQRLLAADQARQDYDLALQSALRLVQADPLREEAHRALMRLYYLLGRTDDALRAFAHCSTLLDTELGVEPEAETLSLYEELRALQQRRSGGTPTATIEAGILQDVSLVGRASTRAEIMEAVEQALAGAGGLVLLAGEAGQGKSRLLREVAAGADWRGAQVSWGRGREDAQALPLGALREALRQVLTPIRARRLAELLPARTLDTLLPLLPELTELLPEQPFRLHDPGEQPVAALHAALASVLLALGQIAPQLLILEDLHWFDRATLDALAALLPALRGARVLLILSGRAEELAARPPVWNTLLQLDRSGLMRRVELHGLDEDEVAELVRRALRMQHPAPRFSARLAAATGGNPYFILETLRALHEQGTLRRDEQGIWHTPWDKADSNYQELPLPAGLRQAIDGRVHKLTQAERTALAAAAVLGQNFSPSVLAHMTKDERPTTKESSAADTLVVGRSSFVTDQLLRRQFLAEDGTGYRFEHELLREVIYDRLDLATRQDLHLRAAEALEHEHFARVEALAQHLYLAGAWDKAIPYLIQAGDHARVVYAYRDALRCYDQALESAEQPSTEATIGATLWDIQLKRGAVATLLGEYADATAAYSEVLRLAKRDQAEPGAQARLGVRRNAQIQALNGLGFLYGQRNNYMQARRVIEQAMQLAAESPRLMDRAETFYQAGLIHFRQDNYGEARCHINEALQLYDALDRNAERAKCLLQIGFCHLRQDGLTDEAIGYFNQALNIYRQQGDRFAEHSCLGDIAGAYLVGGRLTEVVRAVDQCLVFFRSVGALDDVAACLFLRGEACRRMGRQEEALAALHDSLAISMQLSRIAAAVFSQVRIAATLRDLGRYDQALTALEPSFQTEDRMIKASALLVAADIWRAKAQIDRAWACLAEGFALVRQLGTKAFLGVAYRLIAQLRIADTHRQLPQPNDDAPDVEASFAESMRLLQEAHSDDELALSCMADGQYLAVAGRPAEARAKLIQAQQLMSRCGMAGALEQVRQLLQALPPTATLLQPGQLRVMLARRGVPRGRPLRPDELIEVIWNLEQPAQREVGHAPNKATARQEILLRLCAEANAQDAEPTVGDLASALGVTPRTVDRDIAALRAAGKVLVTRGGGG
jgi:DNA-binding SARP family transcriptional activator/DNA-binding transcriptional ArsR family regulator